MLHPSPNIQKLSRIDHDRLEKEIGMICFSFLKVNSTGDNHDAISQQFASDVILTRPDWKLTEVKVFFDTIRQRQDMECFKIMGNKITSIKLMEMVGCFEFIRAEIREQRIKEVSQENEQPVNLVGKFDQIYKHIDSLKPKKEPVNHLMRSQEEKEFEQRVINATEYTGHKDHFAEFDRLWLKERKRNAGSQRVIEVDGQMMTSIEYFAFMEGIDK